MNINPIKSPSFSGIYADESSMNENVKKQVSKIITELEYESSVDELDAMGVDICILANKNNNGTTGAKFVFADPDNRTYKIGSDYCLRTGGLDNADDNDSIYTDFCVSKVLTVVKDIVAGKMTAKTEGESKLVKKHFPMRENVLNNIDFPDKKGLDFDDEEYLISPEYDELEKYGIFDIKA